VQVFKAELGLLLEHHQFVKAERTMKVEQLLPVGVFGCDGGLPPGHQFVVRAVIERDLLRVLQRHLASAGSAQGAGDEWAGARPGVRPRSRHRERTTRHGVVRKTGT